jgi:hypothetical protein
MFIRRRSSCVPTMWGVLSAAAASVMLLASAGCGPPPKLESELETAASWTATAELAADERRRGATSARYTAQLRDAALDARTATSATLAQLAHTPDERARARAALDSMDHSRRALEMLVGAP